MSGFSNPVVNNLNALIRSSIESPNYVAGVSGWAINKDGTAQFNQLTLIVQTTGAAVLIYAGSAGPGTLIGSWASADGMDQYGNEYPSGLNASQGSLTGINIINAQIVASTIVGALLQGPTVTQAAITGGTMTETTIVFDSTGGGLLVYSTTTTTVTFNTPGQTTWTSPVSGAAKVKAWGSGAGGGGGAINSNGGFGGGAGEFAEEPNYSIISGHNYDVIVAAGGIGGTSGNPGQDGDQSSFDGQGVVANGGQASNGSPGGTGSQNTIHHDGGSGGNSNGNTGGGGGGGSAGESGPGGNGNGSTGSGGASGGAAGTGGGATGGNGGSNGNNGSNGSAPGAGGGGAGMGVSSTTGSNQYRLSASATYYGSDASSGAPPNGKRFNGTMYQGGETASGGGFNGTMKSLGIIGGNPQSDLSGKTIDSVSIRLENLHSWYNSGMSVQLGYTNHSSLPSSWNGSGITSVKTFHINEGAKSTIDLTGGGLGGALQSGAAQAISLGPGPAFNLNYYGYFYGAGGDNNQNPLITVAWHTGAAPNKAGNGNDGQVQITYTSGQTLIAAISPAAGSDTNGNAFASGFTGQVTAFQPGSSPTVAETWHDFPAGVNSWGLGTGGWKKYRMTSTGSVEVSISLRQIGTKTDGTVVFAAGALPTGYQPGTVTGARKLLPIAMDTSAATFYSANHTPYMSFNTDGSVTIFGVNATGLSVVDCHGTIPLI